MSVPVEATSCIVAGLVNASRQPIRAGGRWGRRAVGVGHAARGIGARAREARAVFFTVDR